MPLKLEGKILVLSICCGALFWFADACLDYFFFYSVSFGEILFTEVPAREVYNRTLVFGLFVVFGVIVSRLMFERRQAEIRFREKENQFSRAQRLAGVGSYQFNFADNTVTATSEARRIYGVGNGVLTIDEVRKVPLPEERERLDAAMEALVHENRSYDLEFAIRRPNDGRIRHVRSMAEYDHKTRRFIGAIHDITDRKNVEAALREGERQYRFITENISDIILICDEMGNYTYVSPSHKTQLGRGEEIIGRSAFEHMHPDDAGPMMELFAEAMKSGKRARGEFRFWHPERGYIWLESAGQRHGDPEHEPRAIITTRDITDRKQAEAALQASEVKFRSIFDFSSQAIALTDVDTGRIEDVNPKFCEFLGYEKTEVLNKTTIELGFYCAEDRQQYLETLHTDGEVRGMEMALNTKNGSVLYVLMFGRIIAVNQKPYILTIFLNITDQKRLEAQLRQAHKMEAVGRLAGGVAHDFNNMLNIILGYAEMLLWDLPDDGPLYRSVEQIQDAAQRSAGLVRQLLAFSRKQAVEPRVVNLNQVIASHTKMLSRLIGENIQVDFVAADDLWSVWIDASQVDQVLANLAVNARDAIDGNGRLTIETANVHLDKPNSRFDADLVPGDYVMLAFSDTGAGMAPETLDQMFEPFFTTKGVNEGTGLGLATVYGIVRQNNGHINVYSQPGMGTTLKIYFPRQRGEAEAPAADTLKAASSGTETILVVEDQHQVLDLARKVLERKGYTVLSADTPDEALEICKQDGVAIDLLLTDVVMPQKNGPQLCAEIEAIRPGIRTLFMSGYTEETIAGNGVIDLDVNFVQKPFSVKALAEKVREVLDQ
ncbi:MAG: PAS domain S-box protein [Thermodesulfobacteriota bacterium]